MNVAVTAVLGRAAGSIAVFGLLVSSAAAEVVSVMPLRMPDSAAKAASEAEARESAWLAIDFAGALAALETGPAIEVPFGDAERADLEAMSCTECPNRAERLVAVGINSPVEVGVALGGVSGAAAKSSYTPFQGGVATLDDEGRLRWTLAVATPGASGSRLHLQGLGLPDGLELYSYGTTKGEVFGPYPQAGPIGDGDLWTNTIGGDAHFLELRATAPEYNSLLGDVAFTVSEVGLLSPDRFGVPGTGAEEAADDLEATGRRCSYNANCIVNGECYTSSTFPAIDQVRDGIAFIVFSLPGGQYICSGGLLNDTGGTGTPYFLTANHCFSTQPAATSAEFYWDYRRSSCGAACNNPSVNNRSLGATLLASKSATDFTFLRLNGTLPAGRVFLGWNTASVHNQVGMTLHRISHPQGAPQSYTQYEVDSPAGTCSGIPLGDFIYSTDTLGATEGGSSGSPVTNSSGQVVGQLFGACGTNVSNVCDSVNNNTVDGAFRETFETVQEWLVSGCSAGSISPTGATWPGGGVQGASFQVNAQAGCAWTAQSNALWITLSSSAGVGNGSVVYSVISNGASQRIGTITVGDQTFTVTQQGLSCNPTSATPDTMQLPASATSSASINVTAAAGCSWTASVGAPWITLTTASGTSNGSIVFNVAANPGASRSAIITVGTRFVTINQAPGSLVAEAFYGAVAPVYTDIDDALFGGQAVIAGLDPKSGGRLELLPTWSVDQAGIASGIGDLAFFDTAKGATSDGEIPLTGKMKLSASAKTGTASWKNSVSLKGTSTIDGLKASASLKGSEAFQSAAATPDAILNFKNFPGFSSTASMTLGTAKANAAFLMTDVAPGGTAFVDHAGYTVSYTSKSGSMSGQSVAETPFGNFGGGTLSGKIAWQTEKKGGTVQIKLTSGGFTASNKGNHTVTFAEFDAFATPAPLEARWTPTALSVKSGGTTFAWK